MRSWLKRFVKDEAGGEVVDYVLVVGLMTVACFVIMGFVGQGVKRQWTTIFDAL